jgi:hypothetical protein
MPSHQTQRPVFLLVTLVALGAVAQVAPAAEQVTVDLKSGGQYRGELDARTNAEALWLRRGEEGIALRRKIAWQGARRRQRHGR